jgi:hypothetical protein
LQPADLVVAAETPDVHDGQLGALVALLDLGMAERKATRPAPTLDEWKAGIRERRARRASTG